MKYHFLNGKTAEAKEFANDAEAVAAAQKDKSVIRVQCDKTLKYVHEVASAVAKATALLIACLLIGLTASAATIIGVLPNGPSVTSIGNSSYTNQLFGVNTNGIWPGGIYAGGTVTNITAVSLAPDTKTVGIQMNSQVMATIGASPTNHIWFLGRNIQGGAPTNAIGTGLNIEWFATVTNTIPASAVVSTVYTSTTTIGPVTGATTAGAPSATTLAGYSTLYIGGCVAPANCAVTNYQFYVSQSK
jgi:hypothetical protein